MNPKFAQFVDEAIQALPAGIRKAIGNVAIVIEPFPRSKMSGEIEINRGSILLGLYQGIPQNVWGRSESGLPPDKITIFQNTIEMLAGASENKLRELVKDVVWHEIGHHFGFNEEQMRKIERKRKRD